MDDYLGDDILGDDYLGDDYLGDDILGDALYGDDYLGEADILGAVRRRARSRRGGSAAQRMRAAQVARARMLQARRGTPAGSRLLGTPLSSQVPWRGAQVAPGVMAPTEQQLLLGFLSQDGVNAFVNAGPNSKLFVARPQKPFRGERLIVQVVPSAGAVGQLVRVTSIFVGVDPQFVATNPVPAATFGPGAFDTRLAVTASTPGIDVTIGLDFIGTALPVGESIQLAVSFIGKAIM